MSLAATGNIDQAQIDGRPPKMVDQEKAKQERKGNQYGDLGHQPTPPGSIKNWSLFWLISCEIQP
jgi:hypothetical protein